MDERSNSGGAAREKVYIRHLSSLIGSRILQPEVEVSKKMFPIDRIVQGKSRAKSNAVMRNQRIQLSPLQSQKKKQLSNPSRDMPRSVILQHDNKRTQFHSAKSLQVIPNNHQPKGQTMKFYTNSAPFQPYNSTTSLQQNSQPTSPRRNYLRRGSNIQKQIVINLLRSKVRRVNQPDDFKYSKHEIMKMIMVYKGCLPEELTTSGRVPSETAMNPTSKEKAKDIKGWDNYAMDDQLDLKE